MNREKHAVAPPLLLKLATLLFIAVLIPTYWWHYGPKNFLWFSDIALFLTALGILLKQRLFYSMAAVGSLCLESIWVVDYFTQLFSGVHLTGLTAYMFDSTIPLWLRGLSLFHLILPPLLLWLVYRFGYDNRAFICQLTLATVVLVISWFVSPMDENINWVFGYKKIEWPAWLSMNAFAYNSKYAFSLLR